MLNYFRPEDFEKVCATLAKSCSANGKIHFLGWHRPQMASRPLEFILEEDLDVYFNSKSKNTLNSIEWKKAKLPKIFQDCVIERTFLTRAGIEEFVLMRACES